MSTLEDLAKSFASQIREAAARSRLAKSASALQEDAFPEELRKILVDTDGLIYSESKRPLSSDDVARLYRTMDNELGIETGTLEQIRKGSVQNLVAYQQMAVALRARLALR